MLRKIITGIITLWAFHSSMAQQPGGMLHFDTLTYQYYVNKNWNEVIKSGNKAIDNNIDFFYLRMRIGIAWFEKNNYRKAIPHFSAAHKMNPKDRYVNEYLYYSYQYSGRYSDASILRKNMPEPIKNILFSRKQGLVHSFGLMYAYSSNPTLYKQSDFSQSNQNQSNTRSIAKSFTTFMPEISLRLSAKSNIKLAFGQLNKTNHYYINSLYSSPLFTEQKVKQTQFYLSTQINPGYGWKLWAGYQHIGLTMPVFYEGAEYGLTPGLYTYNYEQKDNVFSLGLTADVGSFRISPYLNYSTLNLKTQVMPGMEFIWFPLGNLNLYATATLTSTIQSIDGTADDTWITAMQEIGIKVSETVWLEGGISLGDIKNYTSPRGKMVYNSPNMITKMYFGRFIIPLKNTNMTLTGTYAYNNYQNISSPIREPDKIIKFQTHTLSTGLHFNF